MALLFAFPLFGSLLVSLNLIFPSVEAHMVRLSGLYTTYETS